MTTPPPWRREFTQLIPLALPLILAQLAQNGMSFIDTLMVGRLGNQALAGIALGSTLLGLLYLVLGGVVLAVGPLVSQAYGADHPEDAARAVRQGLLLGTVLFVPALLVCHASEPLFRALGQAPETARLASGYLRAVGWGLLPGYWWLALRGLLEGHGVTRPIMLISFAGVGLNVVLNDALMFGRWGLPALGLTGTGYATTLVYTFIFLAGVVVVRRTFAPLRVLTDLGRLDVAMMREMLRVGVPIALTLGFEVSMFSLTALLMGTLGSVQLAAHQIVMQSASITFMVPLGLSIATSVRVGQARGRGDLAGARRAGWAGIMASAVVMCVSAIIYWRIPEVVIGLYLDTSAPENARVVALATQFFAFAAMFQIVDGVQVGSIGALRGLKDTRVPMLLTLLSYWGVGLSSGVVLAFVAGLGGAGLWLGLVLGLSSAALLLSVRFARLTRPEPGAARAGKTGPSP